MSNMAIRVENLGKQYRIGGSQAGYRTIRESLVEAVQMSLRRLSSVVRGQPSVISHETIWALKDVSLEVQRGEVVDLAEEDPKTGAYCREVIRSLNAASCGIQPASFIF